MANEQNLKPFTSEHQPQKTRKGVPNRSKVYKTILTIKLTARDGEELELPPFVVAMLESGNLTLYQVAAIGQAVSAVKGNTKAWQEIQDSIHGKITDEQNLNISGELNVGLKQFRESAQKQYDAKRDTDES